MALRANTGEMYEKRTIERKEDMRATVTWEPYPLSFLGQHSMLVHFRLNVETTFSLRSVSASPLFPGCRRLLQVSLAFNWFLLIWLLLHMPSHFLSLHLRTRF